MCTAQFDSDVKLHERYTAKYCTRAIEREKENTEILEKNRDEYFILFFFCINLRSENQETKENTKFPQNDKNNKNSYEFVKNVNSHQVSIEWNDSHISKSYKFLS